MLRIHIYSCIRVHPRKAQFCENCMEFQAQEACFRPYKAFCNLHTLCSLPAMMKPVGCSIYISSSRSPCKNTNLTSIWWISQSSSTANASKSQSDSKRATGEKVSSKSTPSIWVNPLATSLAQKRPSTFFLKTHLFLTTLRPLGRSVRVQTLSLARASNSYWHASSQASASTELIASLKVYGSL